MTADSATGSPSKRSTARRRRRPPARRVCSTSAFSARRSHVLLGISERQQRLAAAFYEERRLSAEQHDRGAGHAGGATRRPLRPGESGAVRLSRVGGREHERLRLFALARPQLAQPLDRTAERELGAAETLDEVAAAAEPERLERPQLRVDGAVAAGDALGPNAVAGDDPLALEQQLGQRSSEKGHVRGQTPDVSRRDGRRGPASLRRRWHALLGGARSGAAAARFSASRNGGAPAVAARRRSSPRRPTRDPRAQAAPAPRPGP